MTHEIIPTITVGDLLATLREVPKDTELSFSGLTFNRLKWRGPNRLDMEFVEQVYRNTSGVLVVQDREVDS